MVPQRKRARWGRKRYLDRSKDTDIERQRHRETESRDTGDSGDGRSFLKEEKKESDP